MKPRIEKTTPFSGQKPGTSGLRKKTRVFQTPNYLENFVQSTLNVVNNTPKESIVGKTLVLGGDGRFYNDIMCQTIIRMACANGAERVVVGQDGLLSTPAVSNLIRKLRAAGAFILTASHNPGGIENDCGIKYNTSGGGPAQETLTEAIFKQTETLTEYKISDFGPIDLSIPNKEYEPLPGFKVSVVSSTEAYLEMCKELFDFSALASLMSRSDFLFVYDSMGGVAGPYAKAVFHTLLGVPLSRLANCDPSPDFLGGHPDPNLTYAHDLVHKMGLTREGIPLPGVDMSTIPDFGAAADGDADRNMILGKAFFVTPSDSLAVLASHVNQCVPYFQRGGGLKAIARSMPTSAAADLVAKKKLGVPNFETPVGWKFFVSLCDAKELGKGDWSPLLCGEESFGTGSSHIREKDGIFAVLCWLSVLAHVNTKSPIGHLISVEDIVFAHWKEFGRNHYQRFDYEDCDSGKATNMMSHLTEQIQAFQKGMLVSPSGFELALADEFSFTDPVDGITSHNQGWRFLLRNGSRFVFRLSGTGSSGATVRLYIERLTLPEEGDAALRASPIVALKSLAEYAVQFAKVKEFLGRDAPTVIT